ncbi:MAG: folate-binding protein [Methylococcales bacterium]|nr:folate-binding protein [Methylococcales bacterium]
MNPDWKNFLISQQAVFATDTDIHFPSITSPQPKTIYPVPQLAVLTISGADAVVFLQGQTTCDVKAITDGLATIGALCTAKGRVISTFLLLKSGAELLMVLPLELLPVVKKRLQMYVLRSNVQITDSSETLCLMGLYAPDPAALPLFAVTQPETGVIGIQFSAGQNRQLLIAPVDSAMAIWSLQLNHGFTPASAALWQYLDIVDGIPWLGLATSEEFIPQMLNLDELGGISYNKGCYTGQEIVARTHYLGKAKRALFVASLNCPQLPAAGANVFDGNSGSPVVVGKVLLAAHGPAADAKLLLVIAAEDSGKRDLFINDNPQHTITLL